MKIYVITNCLAYLLFGLSAKLVAQISIGGRPSSWEQVLDTKAKIVQQIFPSPNMSVLEKEDKQDEIDGAPPRFGFLNQTNINLLSGEYKVIENKEITVWQIEIVCTGALSVNFVLDKFYIPLEGKLFIYSSDRRYLVGAFTSQNNKGTLQELRGFGTGLIYGERVILEYEQPKDVESRAVINISGVVHGYRYIRIPDNTKGMDSFGSSGSCQVNVNCPEGDNWQNEKRGIAMILVGGTRWCTGSLVNNTLNNGDLLFITAHHCRAGRDAINFPNATDWSFWWDYESPNCNNPSTEPVGRVTNGATFLANNATADFALLRLSESPHAANPPINVYFNGWDRSNNPPNGGVGIHHPKGDIKKISNYNITPISNSNCTPVFNNYWEVNWAQTANGHSVMQPGSSGSPLITSERKIIGQLFGPFFCLNIQCDAPANQQVVYGRISVSWTGGGLNTNRLSNWLDPLNSGATSLNGAYFNNCPHDLSIIDPINVLGDFQADASIHASNTIASGATVIMKAGHYIQLLPGFSAYTGSNVSATIAHCVPRMIQAPYRQAVDNNIQILAEINEPKIKLFPNPTNDKFTIELNHIEKGEVSFRVFNILGEEMLYGISQFPETGTYSINSSLEPFPPGVYVFAIQGKNFKINKKIIKN